MEPFYFGQTDNELLGQYHAPQGVPRDAAVLVCAPFLTDYMRTHSMLRTLALDLADLGYPTLRFDYLGTGDSSGDLSTASVESWCRNISDAGHELQAISGANHVIVFGIRLGALLAVEALKEPMRAKRFILLDPILCGSQYLLELRQSYDGLLRSHDQLTEEDKKLANEVETGYAIPQRLSDEITKLKLDVSAVSDATLKILWSRGCEAKLGTSTGDSQSVDLNLNWSTHSETVIPPYDAVPDLLQEFR